MKRILGLVTLLAALAVGVLGVNAASGSSTNFKGTYKGKVHEVTNGNTVTATPNGAGSGSVIGKGTLLGTVLADTTNAAANGGCATLTGPGTIKGKKATLKLKLTNSPAPSRGCAASQDDQTNINFSGTATVTGGTGTLKKAKGALHFFGQYNRTTGAFSVTLTGTLKY
jgi:hypothetical protein